MDKIPNIHNPISQFATEETPLTDKDFEKFLEKEYIKSYDEGKKEWNETPAKLEAMLANAKQKWESLESSLILASMNNRREYNTRYEMLMTYLISWIDKGAKKPLEIVIKRENSNSSYSEIRDLKYATFATKRFVKELQDKGYKAEYVVTASYRDWDPSWGDYHPYYTSTLVVRVSK